MALSYSTPAYRSRDQDRAITLVYSSDLSAASGFVTIDANPNSTELPQTMSLSLLQANGNPVPLATGGSEVFYTAGTGTNRLTAAFDASSYQLGDYQFTAVVRNWWPNEMRETRIPVHVLIANQRTSEFGSGWSVAGLQVLSVPTASSDAVIFDGTTVRRFTNCGAGCWQAPPGASDVIAYGASGTYEHRYRDGSIVVLNMSSGKTMQVRDRLGNATNYDYDGSGRLWHVTDPAGQVTTISWTGSPGTAATGDIATPGGRVSRIRTDGIGQLIDIMDPDNVRALAVTYSGNLIYSVTNRLNATTDFTYDRFNGLASITSPAVQTDDRGFARSTTTVSSRESAMPGPGLGYSSTAPGAFISPTAVWLRTTSQRGDNVSVQSNGAGDPTTTISIDALGNAETTIVGYNSADQIATVWGSAGTRMEYTWSGDLLHTVTDNVTQVTTTYDGYNQYGQVGVITIGANVVAQNAYTADARSLLQSSTSVNSTTNYTYDGLGRVSTITDGAQHQTSFAYEPGGFGNLASVTKNGMTTQFAHDGYGRVSGVTNPIGQLASAGFDLVNRPISATAPGRGTSGWAYDDVNRTATFTDALGQQYRTTANALGAPITQAGPASATLLDQYRYDSDGNLSSFTTRAGRNGQTTYDLLGRPTSRSADGAPTTTIAYDPARKWVAYSNTESTDTVYVDGSGRVSEEVTSRNGATYALQSSFGAQGERQSLAVGSSLWTWARVFRFGVDALGQPNYVGSVSVGSSAGKGTTIAYNQDQQPQTITLPTGTASSHLQQSLIYGGNERLTGLHSTIAPTILNRDFGYDQLDRTQIQMQGVSGNMDQRDFYYDAGGRLAQWRDTHYGESQDPIWVCSDPYDEQSCYPTYPTVATILRDESYTYDAVGNRTDRGGSAAAGNRLMAFNGYTLSYDNDGNVATKSGNGHTQTFTWNGFGQLSQVVTDGLVTTFGYDGLGRRVRKTANGVTTRYLYDGDNLVIQLDGSGQPQLEFSYYPGVDHPHTVRQSATGAVYHYITAPPGNVIALVDQNNQVVNQYVYTPFGQTVTATEQVAQPFRFAGRELDVETGLYYNRARYYDPSLGRFISEDPIGLAGGVNSYAYAGNNPVDFTDPSGFCDKGQDEKIVYTENQDGQWVETKQCNAAGKWVIESTRTLSEEDKIQLVHELEQKMTGQWMTGIRLGVGGEAAGVAIGRALVSESVVSGTTARGLARISTAYYGSSEYIKGSFAGMMDALTPGSPTPPSGESIKYQAGYYAAYVLVSGWTQ